MPDLHLPSDWPEAVDPPGTEDWEISAVEFLLEWVPDYRMRPDVRRFPVVLAWITRHTLDGAVAGAREGYRTARTGLQEVVPPHAVEAALRDFRDEGRRLARAARAARLVERALRGEDL